MNRNFRMIAMAALLVTGLNACKKDAVEEENDNEVVTTLELHVTERNTTNHQIFKFDDPDGFGAGNTPPTVDEIQLAAGKTYDVELKLLNKTATPEEDVTGEIEEEAAAHRFYFLPSTGSNITIDNLNTDGNGVPVGLTSTWTTGAASNGTIRVVLRHYPDGGKATGDAVDNTKSNTDIDTEFDFVVK
ncbi:MAG: hypothetical protein ABW174_14960 [Flavitalea sp.]